MSYTYTFEITNGTQSGGAFTWDGTVSGWNAIANDQGSFTATGQQNAATFNITPPGATGTAPGQFRPGISGVINYPLADIQQSETFDSSVHIVFTNNVWTLSHSSGYVWTITRTASGSTGSEGLSYSGTLTVNGTTLEYEIPSTASSGTYMILSSASATPNSSPVHAQGTASTGSVSNFDQTKIWTLLSPLEDELDRISPPGTGKRVFCNFW